MSKRTGSQIVWECLVHEGVTTVFGYPGGAILPTYDAMLDYPVRHVLVRHEQGATHMADGYARAGGGVGVAMATSGPGRDESGHRYRYRDDGLLADRLHHRSGAQQADWLRRVSGDRHRRHHPANHEAQLSRHAGGRHHARDEGSVPSREVRTSRPRTGRYHQGRAAGVDGVGVGSESGEDARVSSRSADYRPGPGEGDRADSGRAAPRDSGRAGGHPERRDAGADDVRRSSSTCLWP